MLLLLLTEQAEEEEGGEREKGGREEALENGEERSTAWLTMVGGGCVPFVSFQDLICLKKISAVPPLGTSPLSEQVTELTLSSNKPSVNLLSDLILQVI